LVEHGGTLLANGEKRDRASEYAQPATPIARVAGCVKRTSSFIRTLTVGPGVTPDLRISALAGFTAGGELHPAPKTLIAPAGRQASKDSSPN
jgi:hypothetical protein